MQHQEGISFFFNMAFPRLNRSPIFYECSKYVHIRFTSNASSYSKNNIISKAMVLPQAVEFNSHVILFQFVHHVHETACKLFVRNSIEVWNPSLYIHKCSCRIVNSNCECEALQRPSLPNIDALVVQSFNDSLFSKSLRAVLN